MARPKDKTYERLAHADALAEQSSVLWTQGEQSEAIDMRRQSVEALRQLVTDTSGRKGEAPGRFGGGRPAHPSHGAYKERMAAEVRRLASYLDRTGDHEAADRVRHDHESMLRPDRRTKM